MILNNRIVSIKMKLEHILYVRLLFSSLLFLIYAKVTHVTSQPNTPELRKLLQYHNDLRSDLMACKLPGQPPAKRLPMLQWDNELASTAKDLANECYFHHNDVELKHKWDFVGQNIAGYQTLELAFNAWKEEHEMYSFYSTSCSGVCGHYTQLVWQNTTHVGCGITNCTGYYGFPYGLSVVCNYGPGGNYEGRYPYDPKPSSECRGTTTRRPPTTTPARPIKPSRPPKPDWKTLINTWDAFVKYYQLQGLVTQTCICLG
ncbi:unnamed protein product [Schistosoma turkestanicum]|nr:unnamed protein product [Schistosoma turkestanicum]